MEIFSLAALIFVRWEESHNIRSAKLRPNRVFQLAEILVFQAFPNFAIDNLVCTDTYKPEFMTEIAHRSQSKMSQSKTSQMWRLVGIGLGAFMIGTEFYITSLALPILIEKFHSNYIVAEWTVIIYTLVVSITVLGAARLGDLYDKKKLYLLGIVLFTVGSLLCGFASSVESLIALRALQALGAVFVWGLRTATIAAIFPKTEWGYAQGVVVGLSALGVAVGPGLGGIVLSLGGWRWLFWMNVPIGIVTGAILAFSVPNIVVTEQRKSFDWLGLSLLAIALSCLIFSLTHLQSIASDSGLTVLLATLSFCIFILFLLWESRQESPILDLSLFQVPEFSFNLLNVGLIYIVLGAIQLVLPIFLEVGCHYSPQTVGWILTSIVLVSVISSPITGSLSDRFGGHVINVIGLSLVAAGALLATTLRPEITIAGFLGRLIWLELGIIVYLSPTVNFIMGATPPNKSGTASGLIALSRFLGLVVGTSFFGTLMPVFTAMGTQTLIASSPPNGDLVTANPLSPFDLTTAPTIALVTSIDWIFWLLAAIAMTAIISASSLWIKEIHDNQAISSNIKP